MSETVLSLTHENACDLHTVGRVPSARAMTVEGKTYRSCQKRESLSLRDLDATGRHLLGVSFITSLKSNLRVIRQDDDDDLSRRVLLSEPGGRRLRGRPRLRWEDGMKEDAATLGCRNWRAVTLNWEGWRKLLKESKAHPRL
jgi:hypothetical protein